MTCASIEAEDPAATFDVRSAWARTPARAATTDRPPWDTWQPGLILETVALPPPDLPVPANGVPAPALVLAPAGDGEPVLEGTVVHRYDYDTRLILMGIDDWGRRAHAELDAWARQLEAA